MSRETAPWWLEPGSEECEFCCQTFHHEAGYHCVRCDRPVCIHCALKAPDGGAILCPECQAEDDADDRERQ